MASRIVPHKALDSVSFEKGLKEMQDLPPLKRQLNSWIGNVQMMKARTSGAPVSPAPASVEPVLELLDATRTGPKANDLEKTLHRLVIGQEEAILEIVRTYQTYL